MIGNALHTPQVLFTLIRNVKRQRIFLEKQFGNNLKEVEKNNDGSLDKDDFKKITDYYGLAVPAILGEALCVLRGKKMTLQERLALTCQGAMTGLFDDFFDKQDMPEDVLKTFIEKPGELAGNNSGEKLFLDFYRKVLQYAYDLPLTLDYLRQVYEAQVESKKQAKPGLLSKEELNRITMYKGAISVLFYRSVLSTPLSGKEEDALYQLGGLMQLGNDIFDIYKDWLKKIDTLMTTAKNVNDIRKTFRIQMEKSFSLFYETVYPPKNIKRFLHLISMSFCSRCFVCLDQLEKKERETNNVFLPARYERKDLICDMQKTKNKWKMISHYVKHSI